MSFVWKADTPLITEEQAARAVHEVSLSRNLDELASVLAIMCIRQESNFWCPFNRKDPSSEKYPHDSESDDGRSVAYFQQQNGRAGEVLPQGDSDNWWGPMSCRMELKCSANTFLERLDEGYRRVKNGHEAGIYIQRVQGSAYPDAYTKHWDYAWQLLHRALEGGISNPVVTTPKPPPVVAVPDLAPDPAWRGDPIWLPKVLAAFGVQVSTYTDAEGTPWDQRGHGDFKAIKWVLWHHTGNVNETDVGIAHHPTLGLAANILVHPDGRAVLTGSGVAWHGGMGIYPGIPEDGINQISIGIECAHSGAHGDPWPEVQMRAMIAIGAAIEWFLQLPADHEIAHKEWAGNENPLGINKQGKPDPIDIDMDWFRGEVAARAAAGPSGDGTYIPPEEDWMTGVDPARLNLAIDKIIGGGSQLERWPSRSIFALPGGVDDTVGMLLHTDGNGHTEKVILGALIGYPQYVADVKRVAEEGPAEGTYAADNFPEEAQEFAKTLLPLCGKLASLLASVPDADAAEGSSAAKKAPAKKAAK